MQTTPTTSSPGRPVGVSMIAVLVALQGFALLAVSGVGLLGLITTLNISGWPAPANLVGAVLIGGLLPLVAVLSLVVAWGLWTLRGWAFWLAVGVQVVSLLGSTSLLAQTGDVATSATTSNITFALIVLVYLFADRNVRAAFRA